MDQTNKTLFALVAERHAAVVARNSPDGLFELLRQAAAEVPDQVACHFIEDGKSLTYSELLDAVTRTATGLSQRGVERGIKVGVMLFNVPAFPIAWLALSALGATMVPVNVRYTPREVTYVLENAEATFCIVDEKLLPVFSEASISLPKLNKESVVVHGADPLGFGCLFSEVVATPPAVSDWRTHGTRADLLNIQYTSGTTGFPKGCMLTQDYWLVMSAAAAWRDGRNFRKILCATPFFYMDPQWQLAMTLQSRATMFIAPRLSGTNLMDWIRTFEIEFCLFLSDIVLKQPETPSDRNHKLIRVNTNGLPKGQHRLLEERFGIIARESYGMTEIGTTIYMPMEATHMVGSGACGIPAPFRECRIIDEDGKNVARGEIGELVVRGRGILKGYYRNEEATRDSFFEDGWFRTGDLFRQDDAGYYYIVGRKKDMIRRAGENIAAREVEAIARELDGVLDVAAVPVPDDSRGEEVKIYVVLKPGLSEDLLPPKAITDHCSSKLAPFKVPRYVEYIESLPKTPSDRVEKHKIKDLLTGKSVRTWDRTTGHWS